MRPTEFLRFALDGLRRQKVRTLLTLAGVAVAACTLAVSLSLGVGLGALIEREFKERPGFWEIQVSSRTSSTEIPVEDIPLADRQIDGDFGPDRIARLSQVRVHRYRARNFQPNTNTLTPARVAEFRALPDVEEVRTFWFHEAQATLDKQRAVAKVMCYRCDVPGLTLRLVAGRRPQSEGGAECVVTEMLLYDLGVRSDAAIAAAVGKTLKVDLNDIAAAAETKATELARMIAATPLTAVEKEALRLAANGLPGPRTAPIAQEYTIVGVVRLPEPGDDIKRGSWYFRIGNVYLEPAGGEPLYRRLPEAADGHVESVDVHVRPGGDLPAVVKAIEAEGFVTTSAVEYYFAAKRQVTAVSAGLKVFALVSLLVAALGITNTLVTSVVERTREIGILKAIGATSRQVLGLFLLEGTVIGILGGIIGLVVARLAAGPADNLVCSIVQREMKGEVMISTSVFEFPPWLCGLTLVLAAVVTTLAALYPARRAAKIPPIEALRYS